MELKTQKDLENNCSSWPAQEPPLRGRGIMNSEDDISALVHPNTLKLTGVSQCR